MKRGIIFIVCVFIACYTHKVSTRSLIHRAETIMQEYPDSALSLLRNIDTMTLHSVKQKAEYSLAIATALDKNYIDTTNASLLTPALNYYSKYGSTEEKMKVYYQLGCIQSNAGDYPSACVSFNRAWTEAKGTDDLLAKGKICAALSIAYINSFVPEEQLFYSKQALDWFIEYGDSSYIDNAIYLLAIAYHNNHQPHEADSLYAMVNPNGKYAASSLVGRATNVMKVTEPDPEKALEYFSMAMEKGARLTLDEFYQYAYALYLTNQPLVADRIMKSLDAHHDNVRSLWWKYNIFLSRNDYNKALEYLQRFSDLNDTIVRNKLRQSIYKAETEQYRVEAELAKLENNNTKAVLLIVVFASLFLLAVCTLFIFRVKNNFRQKESMLEQQYSESQRMLELIELRAESKIRSSEDKLLTLRTTFAQLYKKEFALIGQLYNKNLEMSVLFDSGKQAYADKVRTILSEIGGNDEQQALFESRINNDLDNVMSKLRIDFKDFSESDFRLLSYCIVGFHSNTIASIMCLNSGAVRTKKSRLKQIILSSPSPNKDLYQTLI